MQNSLPIVIFALIVISLLFLVVNYFIKLTGSYKNEYLYVKNHIINKNSKIKIISIGSTYSLFACQSFDNFETECFNGAMFSQKLKYSLEILKQNTFRIKKGGVVLIFLSPCVLGLDSNFSDGTGLHNIILPYKKLDNVDRRISKKIIFHFPILKFWKYLFAKEKAVQSLDEKWAMAVSATSKMDELQIRANTWAKQLHIKDLIDVKGLCDIEENIKRNFNVLQEIVEWCISHYLEPIFVVAPLSEKMNSYIGCEFEKKMMIERINKRFPNVRFINMMRDSRFLNAEEYYVDQGFLLNEKGSKAFLEILFEKIKMDGVNGV